MTVFKFKQFEDVDRLEGEGKGISWRFNPDESYRSKALKFLIRVPIPHGVHKFKTFKDAEAWERKCWIRNGTAKRTD